MAIMVLVVGWWQKLMYFCKYMNIVSQGSHIQRSNGDKRKGTFHTFWLDNQNTNCLHRQHCTTSLWHTVLVLLEKKTFLYYQSSPITNPRFKGYEQTYTTTTTKDKQNCKYLRLFIRVMIKWKHFIKTKFCQNLLVRLSLIALKGCSCWDISFCSTRPKPAYGRQGLDWIVGPGYSLWCSEPTKLWWSPQLWLRAIHLPGEVPN